MTDAAFDEMLELLDPEYFLDREGIDYKRTHGSSGAQLNIKECPFCGGDKWKVYMNAESGLGNCFHGSCPKGTFNKYLFIKAYLDADSFRSVRAFVSTLAREQGWRPKKTKIKDVSVERKLACLPASFALPVEGSNLVYLEERAVSAELAEYFHLRYCEKGVYLGTDDYGGAKWQDFSNTVIIPVFDLDGELVTFQARSISPTAEKRYLFPSGLPGTARYLFNGHNAVGAKRVAMGEGVFDVCAIKRVFDRYMDLRDVVPIGSFGKHLSHGSQDGKDQLGALLALKKRGLEELTIMWDGERPAYMDAIDAAKMAQSVGIRSRVARLPRNEDPDECSRRDPRDLVAAFHSAVEVTIKTAAKLKFTCPYR
jgi:DNA primase